MNAKQGERLSSIVAILGHFDRKNRDALDSDINLDASDTNLLDMARRDAKLTLEEEQCKAQAKADQAERWVSRAETLDVQQFLFGDSGEPTTPCDANGAIQKEPHRNWNATPGEGIDPSDGEQITLAEVLPPELRELGQHFEFDTPNGKAPRASNGVAPQTIWGIDPKVVPPGVQAGLLQAILDGANSPKRAIDTVKKILPALTALELAGHLDNLIQQNIVRKNGRNLVVCLPEPGEAQECRSDDPSVVATSESPTGLIAPDEPAAEPIPF